MAARFLRYTNGILLALLIFLTATGLYGLAYTLPAWTFEVHRVAAWAVLILVPWKAVIAWRSLRRGPDRRFDRSAMLLVSLLLTSVVGMVIVSGFLWTWRVGPDLVWVGDFGDAVIGWHWMLGLALWIPLIVHAVRRWPRPRIADFTARRSALKSLALLGGGLAGWQIAEVLARWRADPNQPRAATGSREAAPFAGNAMPVTLSLGESELILDQATWALEIAAGGAIARLTYAELLALPSTEIEATLDCTSGWYSPQRWRGVRLVDALAATLPGHVARAVRLAGQSGYSTLIVGDNLQDLLLATHLGGEPLATWHGFPVRAVAPACRGWQWVKWLSRVDVVG